MEVHHHTHHPKKWKEYFWEFFMLFLAVFCGFLAEIQVEHYIEHQREKKYMASLLEDLQNDAIDLKNDIKGWEIEKERIDTIKSELEKKAINRNHALLYKLVRLTNTNNTFLYHDRTIMQLKNAGNFRLISEKALADSLIEYDAIVKTAVQDIEASYTHESLPYREQMENKLFNAKFYLLNTKNGEFDSAIAKNPDIVILNPNYESLVFEYYNCLVKDQKRNRLRIYYMNELLRKGEKIRSILEEEYHLQ